MLLPYKKNLPDNVYFNEFINDIIKNINLLKKEFSCEFKDIKPDDINKAVVSEAVVTENVVTETLGTNLDNILMSTIEW